MKTHPMRCTLLLVLLVLLHHDVDALSFFSTKKKSSMTTNTSCLSTLPKTASLEGRNRVLQRFGNPKKDPRTALRLSSNQDPKSEEKEESNDNLNVRKQGMASATFNLVKANVGSGILALPVSIYSINE